MLFGELEIPASVVKLFNFMHLIYWVTKKRTLEFSLNGSEMQWIHKSLKRKLGVNLNILSVTLVLPMLW